MKLDELKSSPTSVLAPEPDDGLEEDPPGDPQELKLLIALAESRL
jgi:hypothetical protein